MKKHAVTALSLCLFLPLAASEKTGVSGPSSPAFSEAAIIPVGVLPTVRGAADATTQGAAAAPVSTSSDIDRALHAFAQHYADRFRAVQGVSQPPRNGRPYHRFDVTAGALKEGNVPFVLHHGEPTRDVLVLIHGYTSSPYYVEAIARRFAAEGVTVVVPLLPAHGLKNPEPAMKSSGLHRAWKEETDAAVEIGHALGGRLSLGGFSAGGTLAVNKTLRDPNAVDGGIFLFSAVLDPGGTNMFFGGLPLVQWLAKITEGEIPGTGPNPYRYPTMPAYGGIEVTKIIRENRKLYEGGIVRPVFVAHSVHDTVGYISGVIELLAEVTERASAFIVSDHVEHANLVLDADIPLQGNPPDGDHERPAANPQFDAMMGLALGFFERHVISGAAATARSPVTPGAPRSKN